MDLKDVIAEAKKDMEEADRAFHAGHHDTARKYLNGIRVVIAANVELPATPAGDVTKSIPNEKLEQSSSEKPEQVPGAAAQPGAAAPAQHARAVPFAQQEKKQNQ